MGKIPKPVKPFNHSEDLRKKRLDKWKELFKAIHPEIEVYHFYEDEFRKILYDSNLFNGVKFDGGLYEDIRIIILVPQEDLHDLYIIGLTYDRMFSKREVLGDSCYWNEVGYDTCEPKFFTWEKIYLEFCEISEELKKEIPEPKNPK